MSKRYEGATLEKVSEKLKQAKKKATEEGKGLFVYGSTGTGKTYFITAIAKGQKTKVQNFVELLSEFRDYIQKGTYHDNLEELTSGKYLFIDDIGAEKTSDFVLEFVYLVVNRRYEDMNKTVFTTNLSLEDFRERYGDRILSRIAEMCLFVELNGEDKRLE